MKTRINLGVVLILGLSASLLVAATYKALMLDESGVCSQFVNFNAGAQLYSVNLATEAYAVEHGGTGGMWTLVERWEPESNTSSHTFSSLNGDTDRRYLVVSRIVANGSTGQYFARPNDDSTSGHYHVQTFTVDNTTTEFTRYTSWTGFDIGYTGDATSAFSEVIIDAKTGINRIGLSQFMRFTSTLSIATGKHAHIWLDTSTNITSISVNAPSGGNFGVGSCIELWKLAQ